MKKLISILCAALMTAAAVSPAYSTAESGSTYLPTLNLKIEEGADYTITDSTHVEVDLSGRVTPVSVDISVYLDDTSASLCNVSPKLKCKDNHVRLSSPADPEPCAFDSTAQPFGCYTSAAMKYNTLNVMYTTAVGMVDISKAGKPLVWTGDTSDAYPLITFKATISQFTPDGDYEIYFLTEKEDDPDQPITQVTFYNEDGTRTIVTPNVSSPITISVKGGSDYTLGDVNSDGMVDSADSSLILYANAQLANGNDEFTALQKLQADVNGDGMYDSIDASTILIYNAQATEGDILPFYLWERDFELTK
ncbi:MAG: dockerin type I repeat-containing protein [Ruminococcus sp.]|nr:dockerin type I repeat-containing protein [Ruminococcus sp.]